MANHPVKMCVVILWSEEAESLVSYTLEEDRVRAVTQRLFPLEIPVAEFDDELDDEFARKFGAAILNVLSLANPSLAPFVKVTQAED